MTANASADGQQVFRDQVIPRTVERGRLRKERRAILAQACPEVAIIEGQAIPAHRFEIDAERINRIVNQIVRGLLYHHYPEVDGASLCFFTTMFPHHRTPEFEDDIANAWQHRVTGKNAIGNGVFRYYWLHPKDAPNFGIWILVFYEAVGFWTSHGDSEHPPLVYEPIQ